MPWKGDSAHDEPNESQYREHSVGVSHLEGGGVSLDVLNNWLVVDDEASMKVTNVGRLKTKMFL